MPLDKIGAFAEFAAVNKNALAKIPDYLSFEQAACVPLTALTAYQSFDLMKVKENERIFISGGTRKFGCYGYTYCKKLWS